MRGAFRTFSFLLMLIPILIQHFSQTLLRPFVYYATISLGGKQMSAKEKQTKTTVLPKRTSSESTYAAGKKEPDSHLR